jgi:hypothetical protein
MRFKKGDRVRYESNVEDGFVHKCEGTVTDVDRGVCIVDIESIYAYHPALPGGGRELPARGIIDAVSVEDCTLADGSDD